MDTKEIDPAQLEMGNVTEKNVEFFYPSGDNTFEKFRVHTPKLRIPFDISDKKARATGKVFAKSVTFAMDRVGTPANQARIDRFVAAVRDIDDHVKRVLSKSESFRTKTFYGSLYQNPAPKYDGSLYPPTMRVTVPFRKDGTCVSSFYDPQENPIDVSDVHRNDTAAAIIVLDEIWVSGQKYGINWVIEQLKVFERPKKQTFVTDSFTPVQKGKILIRRNS